MVHELTFPPSSSDPTCPVNHRLVRRAAVGFSRQARSLHNSATTVAGRRPNYCHTPQGTELNEVALVLERFEMKRENQLTEQPWQERTKKNPADHLSLP